MPRQSRGRPWLKTQRRGFTGKEEVIPAIAVPTGDRVPRNGSGEATTDTPEGDLSFLRAAGRTMTGCRVMTVPNRGTTMTRKPAAIDRDATERARAILEAVPPESVRAIAETQIANLEIALRSARTIGMAIGILMERLKLSDCEAFETLVAASQHLHRKLNDIASELVYTGELPLG
jgi:hypothetical protein